MSLAASTRGEEEQEDERALYPKTRVMEVNLPVITLPSSKSCASVSTPSPGAAATSRRITIWIH